jgi:hypothetical protein
VSPDPSQRLPNALTDAVENRGTKNRRFCARIYPLHMGLAHKCRSAATCAPHHGQWSCEVIALSATGQLGMTATGQIQLT